VFLLVSRSREDLLALANLSGSKLVAATLRN
jgi:hypothetical protein